MEISAVKKKIEALAAEVSPNAVTPTMVANIMTDLADMLGETRSVMEVDVLRRDDGICLEFAIMNNETGKQEVVNAILPVAEPTMAGLMSAEDKANADTLKTWYDAVSGNESVTDIFYDAAAGGTDNVCLKVRAFGRTGVAMSHSVFLPAASTVRAGVMTATDKKTLDSLGDRVTKNEQSISEVNDSVGSATLSLVLATDLSVEAATFKLEYGKLLFRTDSTGTVFFNLFRFTGKRYEVYPLWEDKDGKKGSQKTIPYTISVDTSNEGTFKPLNITYGDTTEPLQDFIKNHTKSKRTRWAIQATTGDLPLTPLFEFAVSRTYITDPKDLGEGYVDEYTRLSAKNNARFIPRRQDTRLAYAYDSSQWDKVGDVERGFRMGALDRSEGRARNWYTFCKMPVAGDIVRRGSLHGNSLKAEGTVMYVDRKADGTFEMVWSEGKKVYTMTFGKYTYKDAGGSSIIYRTGMRITKAATLVCDDITHQTKGGTLRDLYIQAGAKYNEDTGYYELNGLTDITEGEMWVIWQEDLKGWYPKGRTNLINSIGQKGNSGGYNGGIDIACICINNKNLEVFNFGASCFARYMDAAFRACSNLKTIDTRFSITPYGGVLGIGTFRYCDKLEEVRFNNRYLAAKATLNLNESSLISKESILSAITTTTSSAATTAGFLTITLHADAYARLKDDADIVAALEAKNGVVTLVSA